MYQCFLIFLLFLPIQVAAEANIGIQVKKDCWENAQSGPNESSSSHAAILLCQSDYYRKMENELLELYKKRMVAMSYADMKRQEIDFPPRSITVLAEESKKAFGDYVRAECDLMELHYLGTAGLDEMIACKIDLIKQRIDFLKSRADIKPVF